MCIRDRYTSDPHQYWDLDAISSWFEGTGLVANIELINVPNGLAVTRQLQSRWFGEDSRYMKHLAQTLTNKDLVKIRQAYGRHLGPNVAWETSIAVVKAHRAS